MKKLIIIMGIQGSSKSYYRHMMYGKYSQFDVMAYQHFLIPTRQLVENSYVELMEAVKFALTKNDVVVMEHTLPFKTSREWYYRTLKNIFPSLQIELVCMLPDIYQCARSLQRKHNDSQLNIEDYGRIVLDLLKHIEIPEKDEIDSVRYVSVFHDQFYE